MLDAYQHTPLMNCIWVKYGNYSWRLSVGFVSLSAYIVIVENKSSALYRILAIRFIFISFKLAMQRYLDFQKELSKLGE